MATTQQIIDWMEDGYLNGFAENVVGDLSAGMDFHAYYGWQTEPTEDLDAVGYWAVVTDYLGNKSLEEFDTREEMEEHQEALNAAEERFWIGDDEGSEEPDFSSLSDDEE